MLRITLAFPERGLKSDPVTLYLGHDADAAARAIKDAPSDCIVARTYILGAHHKQVDLESQRAANANAAVAEDPKPSKKTSSSKSK